MNLKIEKSDIESVLLDMYVFLFIFTMMNREFLLFSLDLRYLLMTIGVILILHSLYGIIKNNKKIKLNKLEVFIIIFYIVLFACNLMWLINGMKFSNKIINTIILYVFNFISVLVFVLYKDKVNLNNIFKSILFSGLILFISVVLVGLGISLNNIMGSDYAGQVVGESYKNFFGYNIRIAGYAQDPNYTSMFMVIFAASGVYWLKNKLIKLGVIIVSIIGFMLSASKTVFIGAVLGVIAIVILSMKSDKVNKWYLYIKNIFVVGIVLSPYVAIKIFNLINYKSNMSTMATRYAMWNHAIDLFEKNPILGNGLTSFKSYFQSMPSGWYVQCHSSIFQLLSEVGIVGIVLFSIILSLVLNTKNKYVIFLTITFSIFLLTSELLHLSLFVFIISVLPLIDEKMQNSSTNI